MRATIILHLRLCLRYCTNNPDIGRQVRIELNIAKSVPAQIWACYVFLSTLNVTEKISIRHAQNATCRCSSSLIGRPFV